MSSFRRTPAGRIERLALTVAIAVCASAALASAQGATAPALKAAFLFNFAKFAEWPPATLAAADPIVFCVINDGAVGEMLVDLTRGRSIDGHALVVSMIKPDAAAVTPCCLLFASGLDAARSAALLEAVADKPIVTVSDLDKFAQLGGVAAFFVESGTMRFAINLEAAQRARVQLSSKLLSLAKIVKDDRDALRR